jgi:anthranilate phosphoribosyltransferase
MIRTTVPSPPAKLPASVKEIGREPDGTRTLDVDSARVLLAAVLDDKVPPLERNALLLAYHIKGETVAELTGFVAALGDRVARLEPPADRPRPVLLPTYNGARRLPNLTALLALLLKRYGVPVLLHGPAGEGPDFGRVATAAVLGELGVEPAMSVTDAQQRLDNEGIAYAPIAVLAPALAGLLALRRRMDLRGSAHTLAKLIDPFHGAGFRVISISHPEYLAPMRDFLAASRADALLLRGTEGEPFANPRRQPQLEWFEAGVSSVLFEPEIGTPATLSALPATIDAVSTAKWITAALAGEVPIPLPILNQLACCLHGARVSRSAEAST